MNPPPTHTHTYTYSSTMCMSGADPGFGNGGGPRFVVSYERSEYKSAGGRGGAVSPTRIFLNLEPLRVNLSVI